MISKIALRNIFQKTGSVNKLMKQMATNKSLYEELKGLE